MYTILTWGGCVPSGARTSVPSASMGSSAARRVAVKTEPSVTTSAAPVCVSQATQARCARPESVQRAFMALSVTNHAHAMDQTPEGKTYSTVPSRWGTYWSNTLNS